MGGAASAEKASLKARVRDSGTLDLFSQPAVKTAAADYVKTLPSAKPAAVKKAAQADGLGEVEDDLFAFAAANPPASKPAKSVTSAAEGTQPGPADSVNERKATAASEVAAIVARNLDNPNATAMGWKWLFEQYGRALRGSQANGDFTPKDAYDALELGINRNLLNHFNSAPITVRTDEAGARQMIARIKRLLTLVPTQTKRTAETDEFQQFSTIPSLAYVANWVANVNASDVMLESSAGIGGLAVYAKQAGADVVLNELSERRAAILRKLDLGPVFVENAEQIANLLPASIKPTVTVLNPPFSATAGRMSHMLSSALRHG